jgi:hypothetical protein
MTKTGRRNKKNKNWRGSSYIIPICKQHDLVPKTPKKLNQKSPKHHKQIQQSSRKKY